MDGPLLDGAAPGRHAVSRALWRSALTTTGVLLVYVLLPLDRQFTAGTVAALAAGVLGLGLLVAWQVRAILQSPHPALRAIEAVAASLTYFLLLFAGTYVVLSATDPAAFTEPLDRVDSVYFVVTVFATVGFGDVSPVSSPARLLVTVQMIGDLVLIGLVLRVFLSAVTHRRRLVGGTAADAPPDDA
ncbi:potassium channel family protein [Blastococcus litoris]|uniref:potassium channel family protein n=1 Tax=Blastococcus litoris TaxID=2171622 RepID=UPI0013DF60E1|nr:potassium channel family protein [Blastococcus litoris]